MHTNHNEWQANAMHETEKSLLMKISLINDQRPKGGDLSHEKVKCLKECWETLHYMAEIKHMMHSTPAMAAKA